MYTVVERDDLMPEFTLEEFREAAKLFTTLVSPFSAESARDSVQKHVFTTYDVDGWDHNGELQEGVKIVLEEGSGKFVLVPWVYNPKYVGQGTITVGPEVNFPCPCIQS